MRPVRTIAAKDPTAGHIIPYTDGAPTGRHEGERGDGGGAGSSEPAVKSHHKKRASDPTDAAEATERSSWSRKEDETILRSVNEYGHRWSRIAESLPGRSEHAIRNRYSRLQNLVHRGKPIVLGSGKGVPLGISLVPK